MNNKNKDLKKQLIDTQNKLTKSKNDYLLLNKSIKKAHKELINSFDILQDLIFIYDRNFNIIRCNKAYQQKAGIPYDQIIGNPYFNIFPKTNKPLCEIENEIAKDNEATIKDGNTIYHSRRYIVKDDEQEYLYSVHILEDITERMDIQEALQTSESQYRRLFETAKDGILILDAMTGLIIDANPFILNLSGYTLNEIIGKNLWEIGLIADISDNKISFEELQKNEYIRYEDLPIKTKNGQLIDVEFISNVYLVNKEKVIQCNIRDITKRKEIENSLLQSNRALKTISAGNQALVHSYSEEELLKKVTDIIVKIGGYNLAIVSYVQDDLNKTIIPMSWSGLEKEHQWSVEFSWSETAKNQMPASLAIRTAIIQITPKIEENNEFKLWKNEMLSLGYHTSIVLPLIDENRVFAVLNIYSSKTNIFKKNDDEVNLLEELANDLAYGIIALRTRVANEEQAKILLESLQQSIQTIAAIVEARDPYTAGHQKHVSELATAIAKEMDLKEEQVKGIHLAAIIHDLGKIQIPAEILSKPSKLSDIEFMLIQTHPQAGYDILKDVNFPWPIANIILQHHEKLDGSGYPQGLQSDQILLEAKIITVADVVEAITSHRPYRAALGIEVALDEIRKGRGIIYDEKVVDTCLKLFNKNEFHFSEGSL